MFTPTSSARRAPSLGRQFWLLASVLTPIVFLSGGCGGGSGGGLFGTPTATPVPAAVTLLSNAPIALGNGQTGTLNATRIGNAVTGTLTVANTSRAALKQTSAISFNIPPNVYNITGSFSPPRGFTLTGTFPAPIGAFSLSGQTPTTTDTGSFSLTAAGQTQSGTLPVISTPTVTPTTPTATPAPQMTPTTIPTTGGGSLRTSGGGTDTLSLTGSGTGIGANFSEVGYFGIVTSNGTAALRLEGTTPRNDTTPYRDIVVGIYKTGTINVGDSFPIGPTTGQHASVLISYAPAGSTTGTVYYGVSGTATITGATATGFSVSLSNVKINGIGSATGGGNDFHTFPTGSASGTYTN